MDLRFLRVTMDVESENKGGISEPWRTRSFSMDVELIHAISPLNTPPMDAASEMWLHDSAKVQGSLNMED